ncbi:MAG: hypothetical protein IIB19_05545 [Chloroflexi bacterium]|nr:hypothetical protein [Chloroflexota bacterium]
MNARTAIPPLVLLAALAVAACRGGNGAPEEEAVLCPSKTPAAVESDGELGLQEVYDRMAEAIRCPGYALHVTFRFPGPSMYAPGRSQAWIDLEGNRARMESETRFTLDGEEFEQWSKEIILAEVTYRGGSNESTRGLRALACHGSDNAAFSVLLGCQGYLEDSTTTVEIGASFNGKSALVLVTEGYTGSHEISARLYVDDSTFLPLGVDIEFVSLDSLPADFFDPASIGYVEKDPEEPLERTDLFVPVYWLGREFEGSGEYPALALEHADAQLRGPTAILAIVNMRYRAEDDEFGYTLVSLALFTPEGWNNREGITLRQPCEETIELKIAGVQATIQRHYWEAAFEPPPCLPHDRFSATVHFDDVVVRIDAPSTVGVGVFNSPYNSEEAMELLVRSLRLRE